MHRGAHTQLPGKIVSGADRHSAQQAGGRTFPAQLHRKGEIMIQPEPHVLKELSLQNEYQTAPVSMEILSDIRTPIEVLKILKNVSGHRYLLESVSDHEKWGRYTFLGYSPSLETEYNRAVLELNQLADLIRHGSPAAENPGRCTTDFLKQVKSI